MGNTQENQISDPCKLTNRGRSDAILTAKRCGIGANNDSGVVVEDGGRPERQIRSGSGGEVGELAGGFQSGGRTGINRDFLSHSSSRTRRGCVRDDGSTWEQCGGRWRTERWTGSGREGRGSG